MTRVTEVSLGRGWPLLLLFVAGVVGIGFIVGLIAAPGDYITQLKMPDLVMPPAISTPLWFALALAFAVAGWRMWMLDSNSTEMRLWLAIQIISWWFSPVFFIMRSPPFALAIILVLAALMVWFTIRAWSRDRVSAYLFIPCVIYIAYVASMTAAIVVMN